MGFLGRLHRNLGDSSKAGAVCVEAPVRFCPGAIRDDRPYRVIHVSATDIDSRSRKFPLDGSKGWFIPVTALTC
jgi:hypothetical protein